MSESTTLFQEGDEQRHSRDRSLRGHKPPGRVPGYELVRFLGAGAYGEVWLALDQNTRRHVAVKFYAHRGGLDWSLLSREVEKLSFMFNDRRVVQLFAVGWDADPPYYVMEFLEQGSLEERLCDGPLKLSQAEELFRELAQGLVHAHAKGLLHCDLKPANVLFGADGKPRLADFGQSRLSHEQTPALGTLFYMAPEQADLTAIPDARWDVYALGAIMYRMLTGQPPRRTPELVETVERAPSLEERLESYRRSLANPPKLNLHRMAPHIDRSLAEIIERCLEVNPHRRFPSAQSVVDALEERRLKQARRPLLVLGALGPAALLLVMTLLAWSGFQRAVRASRDAVLARAAESDRFAAEFVAQAVTRKIERRWELLERAAASNELREKLAQTQGPLTAGDPRHLSLQGTMVQLHEKFAPDPEGDLWFLCNAEGYQVARVSYVKKAIGGRYAFRDYFHGQGKDLPEGTIDTPPLQKPHLSIVFLGQTSRLQMVGFSVPVWSNDAEGAERQVLGVLIAAVPLGEFAELHSQSVSKGNQQAVLVDLRPDEQGKPGAVLEHLAMEQQPSPLLPADLPAPVARKHYVRSHELAALRSTQDKFVALLKQQELLDRVARGTVGNDTAADQPPSPADVSREADRLREELMRVDFHSDHFDPLDQSSDNRWLVAARPVLINNDETPQPTGWMVLIQERYSVATLAVTELADLLMRRSLVALGVVLAVVTCLWGVVISLLNGNSRADFVLRVQRQLGLARETTSSTGSLSSGSSGARTTAPAAGNAPGTTTEIASGAAADAGDSRGGDGPGDNPVESAGEKGRATAGGGLHTPDQPRTIAEEPHDA